MATARIAFPRAGGSRGESSQANRALALYSLPRFEALREVPLTSDAPIRALAFASETELVGVQEGRVIRWDSETGKALGEVRLPEKCTRLALSGDGRLAIDGVSTVLPADAVAGVVRGLLVLGESVVALEEGHLRAWDPGTLAEAWRISTTATSMAAVGGGRVALAGPGGCHSTIRRPARSR